MPFSTLVLTAGISALAPRNYFGKLFRKEDSPIKFDNGQQNPVPKDPTLSEEAVFNSCLTWAAHQTSQAQQLPPEEISAEFSILYAIAKQRNALAQGALVHLIHTPTLGGRLSATIQETALETQLGVQVHRQELSVPFDPTQRGGLAMASGAFIGQISDCYATGILIPPPSLQSEDTSLWSPWVTSRHLFTAYPLSTCTRIVRFSRKLPQPPFIFLKMIAPRYHPPLARSAMEPDERSQRGTTQRG